MRNVPLFLVLAVLIAPGCQSPQQPKGVSLVTRVDRAPWTADGSVGELLTTRNYRIYTTARNPVLVRYLPGFMEAAYQNYLAVTRLPDIRTDEKMPIYMMGSRPEWVVLTKNVIGPAQQNVYLSIRAGGYCYKGVGVFWDMGGLGTFSVAAHEGLHQFFHHRLVDRLPMWAEEGLCVSAEGHEIFKGAVRFTPDQNVSRLTSLRDAILKEYWKPIAQLLPLDAGDVSVRTTEEAVAYYAQLWALSRMLRNSPTYGSGFRRMISDAHQGSMHQAIGVPASAMAELRKRGRLYNRTISQPVFQYYITGDLDKFEREFRDYARQLADLE